MTLDLENQVHIVLGSSRGIGRGIARALLAEGARVVITGRDRVSLNDTTRELEAEYINRVLSFGGDVGSPATLGELQDVTLRKWGHIDGVVANAGAVRAIPD